MLIMLFGNWDKIIKFYLNYLCEIFFGNKLKLVGFVNVKSIKFLWFVVNLLSLVVCYVNVIV